MTLSAIQFIIECSLSFLSQNRDLKEIGLEFLFSVQILRFDLGEWDYTSSKSIERRRCKSYIETGNLRVRME